MNARRLLAVLPLLGLQACVAFDPPSTPPDLSPDAIALLRHDFLAMVFAVVLIVLGAVTTLLAGFNWRPQGPELLSFGGFSLLYGVRLIAWTPSARYFIELSPLAWGYLDAVITYFIPVTVLFFLEPFLGKVWIVRFFWRIQLAYAVVATLVDFATGTPFAASGPYGVLVITWFSLALYFMFRPREPETKQFKIVRAGLLVFVLLAGHATLSDFINITGFESGEPFGLFVFFLALGYVVADRFFASRKELVAIGQELQTARRIQQTVLPERLPTAKGLDIAVRYLPVSAVAGDFYDFLQTERGLSLLVADVSGHGVPAALIASMVKVAYSAQGEAIEHPSHVLAEVNRILCGKIRGQFVTGACLFFGSESTKVRYATAGHPPPVLVRRSGDVDELKLESVLMGFFAEAEYREREVSLQTGDSLVLYTDGLTEAVSSRGGFFGVERLRAFLEDHAGERAEALASGLLDRVTSWSGQPFEDDVTLLVAGRKAQVDPRR